MMGRKNVVIILSVILVLLIGVLVFILVRRGLISGGSELTEGIKSVSDNSVVSVVEDSGINEIISELNKGVFNS